MICLLHLADNLAGTSQGLNHLLALLSSANREVALLEEIIGRIGAVHVLEQLALHLVLGKSVGKLAEAIGEASANTYWTSVSMMALGTMSVRVRLTML